MKLNYLKAKDWQIFLLTFGLFILYTILLIITSFLSDALPKEVLRTLLRFDSLILFPIITIFFTYNYFIWLYSIAITLQKIIPDELTKSTKLFRVAIFFPILYVPSTSLFLALYLGAHIPEYMDVANKFLGFFFYGYLALQLTMFVSMPYVLYFVAKTLKTAELQRKTNWSDYYFVFILLLFSPIGIWILQPKINELYNQLKLKQKV